MLKHPPIPGDQVRAMVDLPRPGSHGHGHYVCVGDLLPVLRVERFPGSWRVAVECRHAAGSIWLFDTECENYEELKK